ncbi:MAG: DUF2358 domain-containing protein [Cyanobacteria bacterium RI_101]|nr:DUF2358 domain-containing protein [Cyanobacteria bacterium RI_101]
MEIAHIIETLKSDYRRFPNNQSYDLYAETVYFKDPLTEFRGLERYKQMIAFMGRWFADIDLRLHDIQGADAAIETRWTLTWTSPLPWRPRIAISGQTRLELDGAGKIVSHIDTWDCSPWAVLGRHFFPNSPA